MDSITKWLDCSQLYNSCYSWVLKPPQRSNWWSKSTLVILFATPNLAMSRWPAYWHISCFSHSSVCFLGPIQTIVMMSYPSSMINVHMQVLLQGVILPSFIHPFHQYIRVTTEALHGACVLSILSYPAVFFKQLKKLFSSHLYKDKIVLTDHPVSKKIKPKLLYFIWHLSHFQDFILNPELFSWLVWTTNFFSKWNCHPYTWGLSAIIKT